MSPAKKGGQIPSFRGYRVAAVVKIEVKLLWNELTRASLLKGGPLLGRRQLKDRREEAGHVELT